MVLYHIMKSDQPSTDGQPEPTGTTDRTPAGKRLLAQVLLVLLILALIHSMYAMARGRIMEALLIYPLLIVCYLIFRPDRT